MSVTHSVCRTGLIGRSVGFATALLFASTALAAEPCGLCDKEVTINSALATCFLAQYQQLASRTDGTVVIDLSSCEQDRGVVEPLAMPGASIEDPDLQFMLTKEQMTCLKTKLEQPGLVLDPTAKIELDSCG